MGPNSDSATPSSVPFLLYYTNPTFCGGNLVVIRLYYSLQVNLETQILEEGTIKAKITVQSVLTSYGVFVGREAEEIYQIACLCPGRVQKSVSNWLYGPTNTKSTLALLNPMCIVNVKCGRQGPLQCRLTPDNVAQQSCFYSFTGFIHGISVPSTHICFLFAGHLYVILDQEAYSLCYIKYCFQMLSRIWSYLVSA